MGHASKSFTQAVLTWAKANGRHDLPWHECKDPYLVWVSEIMLQQTQVKTVLPYYSRFIARYPNIQMLAKSSVDGVLHLWSGLGYYARGRNLHRCAEQVVQTYKGEFPQTLDEMTDLPGIGRSTAGAILSLAYGLPYPILDGNAKRILARYLLIQGWSGERQIEKQLWQITTRFLSTSQPDTYNQALMDLGATICRKKQPRCMECPLNSNCKTYEAGLQDSIPISRPRKELPTKEALFLIVENTKQEILLQKRTSKGVWRGLWSFPECSPKTRVKAWVKRELGNSAINIAKLNKYTHTFTHFRLDILPVHIKISQTDYDLVAKQRQDSTRRWYPKDINTVQENNVIGIPKPVKQLLQLI